MAILCDKNTKLLIQGMGRMGSFHAKLSVEYGTQVVGGVHPGRGGTTIEGIAIYNTVAEAVADTGATASVIFVPPPAAADAILEAAEAERPVRPAILVAEEMTRQTGKPVGTPAKVLGLMPKTRVKGEKRPFDPEGAEAPDAQRIKTSGVQHLRQREAEEG